VFLLEISKAVKEKGSGVKRSLFLWYNEQNVRFGVDKNKRISGIQKG